MSGDSGIKQRWEWEGDGSNWIAYSTQHSDELNDAMKAGKKSLTLTVGGSVKLEIQFGRMMQKNKSTGFERRVRICVNAEKSADDDYYSWEWEDENNKWHPYLHDTTVVLEGGRAAYLEACAVSKAGTTNGSIAGNSNNSGLSSASNSSNSIGSSNTTSNNTSSNDINASNTCNETSGNNISSNNATSSNNTSNSSNNATTSNSASNNNSSKSNMISIKAGGRKYEVDIELMTQRNVATDVRRSVRRVLSAATATISSGASSSTSTSTATTSNAAVVATTPAKAKTVTKATAEPAKTQRSRNKKAAAAAVSESESDEESKPKARLTRSSSKRSAGSASAAAEAETATEEPSNKKMKKSAALSKSAALGKSAAMKSAPESTVKTVVVKGRAPVDPECTQKVNTAHVYCEGEDVYDAMLNQTNIGNNNNKFYLIQLLEDDTRKVYSVWFRWGRVGARGQSALVQCGPDLDDAKDCFCQKFSDKTKNEWAGRKKFQKVAGKYDMVKLDYSTKNDQKNSKKSDTDNTDAIIPESKLDEKLQALIKLICDVKEMEDVVMEMKYDAHKAPLGRLTEDQIKAGYAALKKIDALISKNDYGTRLTEACNDFYTRIPHDFKMSRPPVIRSEADVKAKLQLLEALGDIEIAMRLLQEAKSTENPVDAHYKSLHCDMSVMDHAEPMFKLICDYVKNTHAPTHNQYKMKVLDVFCVEREGEAKRFVDHGSRMLLWHGTRLTNMVGILSHGLRVAPPEAPATGYMFGKGIYFADMSSKSANYCFPTRSKTTGIVLLCEVSLGNMNELVNADYNAHKLPAGTHSVKGLGKQAPNPALNHLCPDGSVMPLGKYQDTGLVNPAGYTLNYNEFIVYDANQVKIRYAVQVHFDFN